MGKIHTHRKIWASVPRNVHLAIGIEAERSNRSMGDVLLELAREKLDVLVQRIRDEHPALFPEPD